MNAPESDPLAAVRATLKQDAARVTPAPFNPRLHADIIRRLRALEGNRSPGPHLLWALTAATALLTGIAFLWHPAEVIKSQRNVAVESSLGSEEASVATVWNYERLLARSDEALASALERDAAALLPATAATFSNTSTPAFQ